MKKVNQQIIFSPSDLINYMDSPFASFMDRLVLENPGLHIPDTPGDAVVLLQQKGIEHEMQFLERLRLQDEDVCEIAEGAPDARDQTLQALHDGRGIIYQGVLDYGNFGGRFDFLHRVNKPSELGGWQYEVWDTKLARKAKPYFIVQLCCYAEMLCVIQGCLPEYIAVVLGDKSIDRYRTEDYFYFYSQLKREFIDFQNRFDRDDVPYDLSVPEYSKWKSYAQKLLDARDDLSKVANIRQTQIRRLCDAGVATMTALASTSLTHVERLEPKTLKTLKDQARLQVQSKHQAVPEFELLPSDSENPRRGLSMLPLPSRLDVWFDMEGYPYLDGGLEYLFGAAFKDGDELSFKDWWAHDHEEEKKAFGEFIEWVYGRWKEDPSMHIYHYASYEVASMRRLMGRHGIAEEMLDDLMRNDVFVDLYQIVRQGLRIGEPSYSIKNVEHIYMGRRAGGVTSAIDSIVFYERWLENPDGDTWQNSRILASIRDYNKQDCDSTMYLTEWLRGLQQLNGITYIAREKRNNDDEEEPKNPAHLPAFRLAQEMLTNLPAVSDTDEENLRVHVLLAYLLQFHRREDKPVFWAMFDRQDMTEEQLIDDIDCLGGLTKTSKPRAPLRRASFSYEYSFDPKQDTKLHAGSKCFMAHDLSGTTIESFDSEGGLVEISLSSAREEPPHRMALIPNEYVDAKTISDSIYRLVDDYYRGARLPQAMEDFLFRRPPRISGRISGEALVDEVDDLIPQVVELVGSMQDTSLCIQGPPGSGKTYLASHVILKLIADGKTVGVTSNAHKAIEHLMQQVGSLAVEQGVDFLGAKIVSDSLSSHAPFKTPNLVFGKKGKVLGDDLAQYGLIGGTAFVFSSDDAQGKLDYLFVDEAGQVSLANLLGMSRSARNLILLGDQMQLEQPIQGAHPGESGKSCLEYFLKDCATIPNTTGVFLASTWRMHPEICRLISAAVYENRLHAAPVTKQRKLVLPDRRLQHLSKDAGVLFIPVPHEGNSQSSDEEAAAIKELVAELLDCRYLDDKSSDARKLTLEDILIVAPYNMQVRTLSRAIPGCRVASVDKFQGQEAPVVICSMSSSESSSSPRGMEFLFSQNRLNVALSRAKTLAVMVASPSLLKAHCGKVDEMRLLNFFCRIIDQGSARPQFHKSTTSNA
jgi:uncharacterized protein